MKKAIKISRILTVVIVLAMTISTATVAAFACIGNGHRQHLQVWRSTEQLLRWSASYARTPSGTAFQYQGSVDAWGGVVYDTSYSGGWQGDYIIVNGEAYTNNSLLSDTVYTTNPQLVRPSYPINNNVQMTYESYVWEASAPNNVLTWENTLRNITTTQTGSTISTPVQHWYSPYYVVHEFIVTSSTPGRTMVTGCWTYI